MGRPQQSQSHRVRIRALRAQTCMWSSITTIGTKPAQCRHPRTLYDLVVQVFVVPRPSSRPWPSGTTSGTPRWHGSALEKLYRFVQLRDFCLTCSEPCARPGLPPPQHCVPLGHPSFPPGGPYPLDGTSRQSRSKTRCPSSCCYSLFQVK